jgi:hypothetical protein
MRSAARVIERRQPRHCVLDLGRVSFMDSSGVALILNLDRRVGRLGGRLRVEVRNRIRAGETLEVLSPNHLGLSFPAANITDGEGHPLDAATVPMTLVDMDGAEGVEAGDYLRVRVKS